jgi:hypothetical protein
MICGDVIVMAVFYLGDFLALVNAYWVQAKNPALLGAGVFSYVLG